MGSVFRTAFHKPVLPRLNLSRGAHSPLPSAGPPGFRAGEAPEALTHQARALLFRTLNFLLFTSRVFHLNFFWLNVL